MTLSAAERRMKRCHAAHQAGRAQRAAAQANAKKGATAAERFACLTRARLLACRTTTGQTPPCIKDAYQAGVAGEPCHGRR